MLARCMRGDKEINAEMVRQGIAFAEGGLVMTRYGSEEKEARAAKIGIWAAGDSARPAEWRSKVWDEAKKRAPEGCPIKGTVA
ncbi:thermonuclease family protein, partial [Acinetobacter baumannii]